MKKTLLFTALLSLLATGRPLAGETLTSPDGRPTLTFQVTAGAPR